MNLNRMDNESELEYHRRLVYGKLVDRTLSDVDYTELSKYVYGKDYASDVARRCMYGSRYTLELLDKERMQAITDSSVLEDIEAKTLELKKERYKFYDQRNALNKLIRERSRQEELNEIIEKAIHNGDLPKLEYKESNIETSDSDLLVSLNDIHYGATHNNYWGEYNSDICKKMINNYLDNVIQIGKKHNCENCIVWENGDAISGNIHQNIQVTNKENVIEQVTGVSELISDFLAELSTHFKKVKFISVSGNHSRLNPNKNDAMLDEKLDDLVSWYLTARLQNFENVEIGAEERIDPTMYYINIRGLNYVGIHGDFDGTSSKVQTLQTMVGIPVYAVLTGHLHHNKVDEVQGIKTIMAGSFLGMDDYCVQKRIVGKPEQMVCVCNKDGVICYYDIPLK